MAAQITAVIIFLVMFAFIITEKIPRHIATTLCSVATLILVFGVCMHSSTALFETLNFQSFTSVDFWRAGAEATESTKGINWQTILYLYYNLSLEICNNFLLFLLCRFRINIHGCCNI